MGGQGWTKTRVRAGLRPLLLLVLAAATAPAEAGFAFRKLITVTGSQVIGGPHVDFPLLVAASDPQMRLSPLGGVRSATGCDISFRAADGVTPLNHEVILYDGASGGFGAYVRLPSIQNGVSTQFYVYYGDPDVTCEQSRHGDVWDAGYRASFPLLETSGNPIDFTSNGVAARLNPQGDAGATLAQTGQALQLINPPTAPPATFIPTTDSHLQLADGTLAANSPFTFEAMFYYEAGNIGQFVGIVTKNRDNCVFPCDQPGEDWVGMSKTNTDRLSLSMDTDGGPGNLDGATVLANGRWYYGAVTSNGVNTRRVILYDVVDAQDTVTAAGYTALANPIRIGDDSNGNYFRGYLSQVRISTVERSDAWLRTTARSLLCSTASAPPPSCLVPLPASLRIPFITIGAQQAVAATATDSDCCRVAASDDGTRLTAATSALAMVFDRTYAGGLSELRNEEEANRTQSRHGDTGAYNIFSTQVNDVGGWHFERDAAGLIEVLDATPTRLRLLQDYNYTASVRLQRVWTIGAMPRLAIDERIRLTSTQDLRGAQGLHPRGATSGGATICPSQLIASGFGTYFYCNGQENSTDRFFLVTDNHETYSDMLAVAYTTPFFGPTRAGTGGNYQHSWEGGAPETFYSRVHEPTQISTSSGTYRNFYMFYPQLAGLTSSGIQWQPYANDYRTPDVLSFNVFGTGWFDAGDLTVSPNDFYNEAEGAYQVDMNPASGLSVNIDGNVIARRRPLFKIRQWRSFSDPTVTLEGTALVNDRDFSADVMPFARAFHCTGPTDLNGCTALANGGLAGTSEYMNDSSAPRNYTLAFPDASTWLYFGADAKFRGINVRLATLGVGTADLQWEYWNGAWTNLETVTGWNDGTNNLKAQGTISWGDDAIEADPAAWSRLGINGGPQLYWVRARLASGTYSTPPVEAVMRTDILLFQYCGDISILGATFAFSVPPTTAVTLQSFAAVPGDAQVRVEWRTASELQNLGFHLYRGGSPDGPWTRLNAALIPGLGSSAIGKGYAFDDAGLTNGVRYYYRLEDVEASSRVTSHGPVSAVPAAAAPEPSSGRGERKDAKRPDASSSCPAWVLTAYAALAGEDERGASLACSRHGDPEGASLEIVSRDAGSATLELRTPGFYALHTLSRAGETPGAVRVFVPGFDFPPGVDQAALPLRRALVDAVVGRRVVLGRVSASDLASFSLRPAALGRAEMVVGRDGTVRAARRDASAPRSLARGPLARLLPSVFQGETKSGVVEITPLRYDTGRRQLTLARRVRVRLEFRGREPGELGRGRLGRALRPGGVPAAEEVLAVLHTAGRGLHSATFEELLPGRARGLTASELRLERQGEPVAFHLEPAADVFGPGSRLYFFVDGGALSTAFSGEVAYELVRGPGGRRMGVVSGVPAGDAVTAASTGTASFEADRFYQPGLLDAVDPWLWESLPAGVTRTFAFTLANADPEATGTARLDVELQGASESGQAVDHHLSVSLNGVAAGEVTFAGKQPHHASLSVPASLLRAGANELAVTSVADTGVASLSFLDRFALAYPQAPTLSGGAFEGGWPTSGTARLAGASGPVLVADVTEEPRWLAGVQAAAGAVGFRVEAGRLYAAVQKDAARTPRVEHPPASSLRSTANQADYLLIAPRAFLAAAEPLVERRRAQGLAARAVAFEEVAAEFGHGQPSAEAIRDFLAHAFHSWARPSPRYVLLVGDASYDPRNFTGASRPAPLPALWARTSYLWTVSDPQLAAVNGDDTLPDLAIGRLPAGTVDEARALVEKLIAWEDSGQSLAGLATLVADNPDAAGDFEADARDIAERYLHGRSELLRVGELGAATRTRIQEALDSGRSFLSYVGHGGAAVWASENVWNSWDAASLSVQSHQPLVLTLNCLNGYFVAPAYDSLAESLIKAEGRGGIAAFSPSGLSLDGPAHQYHRALMAELTGGTHTRLGDAILAAQAAYAATGLMPELLSVYHLLGDPATVIR